MAFHVGQQVVCVDDSPSQRTGRPSGLDLRRVYTIRGFSNHGHFGSGVLLVGVGPTDGAGRTSSGDEPGWDPNRFRPVKQTSIEIFQQLLVNPPREVVS